MKKSEFIKPSLQEDQINELSQKLLETTMQLSKANQDLLFAEKERSEMLSNISHDLRAPLTAIRSAVDLLLSEKEDFSEENFSTISLIDRRLSVMESMIHDMFYLFKLEDKNIALDLERVEIASFLEEYFFDVTIDSRYDNHDMKLDIAPSLQAEVSIDIQKMIRVLDNLFTNAAKYSGDGSEIILRSYISPDNKLAIDVCDNGVGIAPEDLKNIFARTYTVQSARTPGDKSGSGLGLSIVKAVVEKHGGSINCLSSPGIGCSFHILLPIE